MVKSRDESDENFWEAKEVSSSSSDNSIDEQINEFVWDSESDEKGIEQKDAQKNEEVKNVLESSEKGTKENEKKEHKNDEHENETGYENVEQYSKFAIDNTEEDAQNNIDTKSIPGELHENNDDLELVRDDAENINSKEVHARQGNDITNTMDDSFDDEVHVSEEYNKQEYDQKLFDSLDDQNIDYNANDDYLTEDGNNSLYTNNETIDAKDVKEFNNMSNNVIYVDDDNKKGSDALLHESENAIDCIDNESYNLSLNEHNNSATATSLESLLYDNQSMDDDYEFIDSNTISVDDYTPDESDKEDNIIDVKEEDTYNEGNIETIDDNTANADGQFTLNQSNIELIEDNITTDENQYMTELHEKDSDLDNEEENSYTKEDQHIENFDSERNNKNEMNDNDEPIFDIKQETNIDVNITSPTVNETSRNALLDTIYENLSDTESTDENDKKAQANNIDQDLTEKHFITKEIIAQEDLPQAKEEYVPEFETSSSIVSVQDSEVSNDSATSNIMAQDSNSQYADLQDNVDADLCKDSVDSDHTYMHKNDEEPINDEEVYDTIGTTVLEERKEETIIEELRDDIDMPQQETDMDIWSDESDNGFENLLGTDKAVNDQNIDVLLTGHAVESRVYMESDISHLENVVAQSDMNNNGQSLEFLYTDTVDSQQLNNYVEDELAYYSDNRIHDGVSELCNLASKLKQTVCETELLVPENVKNAEQPHVLHKAPAVAPESLIKLTKTESQSSHNYLNDLVESLQPPKQTEIPVKSSVSSFIPKHKQFKIPSNTKSAEQNKEVTIKNYQSKKNVYARKEKTKPSFENRSLICFIGKKVIHNRTFEQKRVSVEGEGYNSCTKSSFTYYKNPESELMKRKELTDYEMSIKKLLNTKIDKIREQIAEIPKFDVTCKFDNKVNSCFDETLADSFFRDPQISVDKCIANDNWLMALLLSNCDTEKREDTIHRFLTKFVDENTLPVYLVKFRMHRQALDRIKSMACNPIKYLNIALMHFDKYFVEEYIKVIASHNRLDALRAYIIAYKLYDVDIDINLFVNNIFALEILNEMDKTKKVANIDFLRFNHINYLLNYNRDEAYRYYAKYKGSLRKEYVAELDAIFVDKKWNFGGFRKVVDLGISKIIGVEPENTKIEKEVVKVQMKKDDLNEKDSELVEKVTVEKSVDNSTTVKMELPKKSEQPVIADAKQVVNAKSQKIETKKPSYGELLKRKSQVHHIADNLFDELKQNNVESNKNDAEIQKTERATDAKPIIDSDLAIDVQKPCKNEEIIPTDNKIEEIIKESPVRKNTLYKNEKFAQSYADFFDKEAVNDLEPNDDTKNLLSQFTRDDSEIGKQTKKVEEPKPDKPSFFSFSRFFKPKEKTYKAKIESDAKFVFDPVTKQWVNKNSDNKPSFDYTTIKKEKTEPKKSDGFVKKTTSAGLSGRYAGMKMSKQSVADLIPGIKKDKNVEN